MGRGQRGKGSKASSSTTRQSGIKIHGEPGVGKMGPAPERELTISDADGNQQSVKVSSDHIAATHTPAAFEVRGEPGVGKMGPAPERELTISDSEGNQQSIKVSSDHVAATHTPAAFEVRGEPGVGKDDFSGQLKEQLGEKDLKITGPDGAVVNVSVNPSDVVTIPVDEDDDQVESSNLLSDDELAALAYEDDSDYDTSLDEEL